MPKQSMISSMFLTYMSFGFMDADFLQFIDALWDIGVQGKYFQLYNVSELRLILRANSLRLHSKAQYAVIWVCVLIIRSTQTVKDLINVSPYGVLKMKKYIRYSWGLSFKQFHRHNQFCDEAQDRVQKSDSENQEHQLFDFNRTGKTAIFSAEDSFCS
jgi:hypothetical protein